MARTNRGRARNKNAVSNVRIVDQYAGSDGAHMDRILASLQNSHSQVRLNLKDTFTLSTSATATVSGIIAGSQVRLFDDFVSVANQFETFRVAGFRFDVYDINPSLVAVGVFSTFHDNYLTSAQPSFTFSSTVDGADSQLVPPGTGKVSFTWMAHGTSENDFLTTISTTASEQLDYGGLRYFISQNSTVAAKYQVVVNAIVDFRGRT
jgi:hypothetical protein